MHAVLQLAALCMKCIRYTVGVRLREYSKPVYIPITFGIYQVRSWCEYSLWKLLAPTQKLSTPTQKQWTRATLAMFGRPAVLVRRLDLREPSPLKEYIG